MEVALKVTIPKIATSSVTMMDIDALPFPERVSLLASMAATIAAKTATTTSERMNDSRDELLEIEHLASHWRAREVKTLISWLNNIPILQDKRAEALSYPKMTWDESKITLESLGGILGTSYDDIDPIFGLDLDQLVDMIRKGSEWLYPHQLTEIGLNLEDITESEARNILCSPLGLKKHMAAKDLQLLYDPPSWVLIDLGGHEKDEMAAVDQVEHSPTMDNIAASMETDHNTHQSDGGHNNTSEATTTQQESADTSAQNIQTGRTHPAMAMGISMRNVDKYGDEISRHQFLMDVCGPYTTQYFSQEEAEQVMFHMKMMKVKEIMLLLLNKNHLNEFARELVAKFGSNANNTPPSEAAGETPPPKVKPKETQIYYYRMSIKSIFAEGGGRVPAAVLRDYWSHLVAVVGMDMGHQIELVPFDSTQDVATLTPADDPTTKSDREMDEYLGKIHNIYVTPQPGQKPQIGFRFECKFRSSFMLGRLRNFQATPNRAKTEQHRTFLEVNGLYTKVLEQTTLGQRPFRLFLHSSAQDDPRRIKQEIISATKRAGEEIPMGMFDVKFTTIGRGDTNKPDEMVSGVCVMTKPEDDDAVARYLEAIDNDNNRATRPVTHDYKAMPVFLSGNLRGSEMLAGWESQNRFLQSRASVILRHLPTNIQIFNHIPTHSHIPNDNEPNEAPIANLIIMASLPNADGTLTPTPFSKVYRQRKSGKWCAQYNPADKEEVAFFVDWINKASDSWCKDSFSTQQEEHHATSDVPPAHQHHQYFTNDAIEEDTIGESIDDETENNNEDNTQLTTSPDNDIGTETKAPNPHKLTDEEKTVQTLPGPRTEDDTNATTNMEDILSTFIEYQRSLLEEQHLQIHKMASQLSALQQQVNDIGQHQAQSVPPSISMSDQVSQQMSDVTAAVVSLKSASKDEIAIRDRQHNLTTKELQATQATLKLLHQEVKTVLARPRAPEEDDATSTSTLLSSIQTQIGGIADKLDSTHHSNNDDKQTVALLKDLSKAVAELQQNHNLGASQRDQEHHTLVREIQATQRYMEQSQSGYTNLARGFHEQATTRANAIEETTERAQNGTQALFLLLHNKLHEAVGVAQDYANILETREGFQPPFPWRTKTHKDYPGLPLPPESPNPTHSNDNSPVTSPPTGLKVDHARTERLLQTIDALVNGDREDSVSTLKPNNLFTQSQLSNTPESTNLQETHNDSDAGEMTTDDGNEGIIDATQEHGTTQEQASTPNSTLQTARDMSRDTTWRPDSRKIIPHDQVEETGLNTSACHQITKPTANTQPTDEGQDQQADHATTHHKPEPKEVTGTTETPTEMVGTMATGTKQNPEEAEEITDGGEEEDGATNTIGDQSDGLSEDTSTNTTGQRAQPRRHAKTSALRNLGGRTSSRVKLTQLPEVVQTKPNNSSLGRRKSRKEGPKVASPQHNAPKLKSADHLFDSSDDDPT